MGSPNGPEGDSGSPRTGMGLAIVRPLVESFRKDLDGLAEAGRAGLVERARSSVAWPSGTWLAGHWTKHGAGLRDERDYADWAQAVKSRPGTEVWAMIHMSSRHRGL